MCKLKGLIYLSIIPLLLAGCWDKIELENRGFVIAIGIDKAEGGEPFAVSMAIANAEAIHKESAEGQKETIEKSQGETLASAMRNVDSQMSRKIYYGHTKVVVAGKDFLDDPDMLREAVDALERNNEINQKIVIVAADGKASDILGEELNGKPLVGVYISDFYKQNKKNAVSASKLDLEGLLKSLRMTGGALIPKIEVREKELKLGGAAVVKNLKLDGWMTEDEMRGFAWFRAQADGACVIAHYEADNDSIPVAFTANKSKCTISFSEEQGKPVCTIKLTVKGGIEEYKFLSRSLFDDEKIDLLEAAYETEISKELEQTFSLLQKKYEVDGFWLKEYLRKRNYPLYLKYADDWDNAYRQMIFVPEVSVSVTNTGANM